MESVGWWECEVISPNNGIIAMTNGCPRIPCVRADEFPHLMRFIDFRQEERGKREKCERARERERKKMTPPFQVSPNRVKACICDPHPRSIKSSYWKDFLPPQD